MNDDLNPDRPPNLPEDALKKALDELIEGRCSRAETPRGDISGAPPASEPGRCAELGAWTLPFGEEADPAGSAMAAQPEDAPSLDDLLTHAAECPVCAGRLRTLIADASPEEAAELGALSSTSRDWQRCLAAQLARTPRRTRDRVHMRPRPVYLWAGAGLAASLLLAAGLAGWWRLANTPERLLAEAYTHSRIFDLRMPGAGFAEVTPQAHLRGGATGRESARLLDARARIERQLDSAPEDPHWLQLEAPRRARREIRSGHRHS